MSEFLYYPFKEKLNKFMKLSLDAGLKLKMVQGYRSVEEQNKLYLKRPKVTNARGGLSWHNYGCAADFVFLDNGKPSWDEKWPWVEMGKIGKSVGLEWGGDWQSFKDRPHFQLTFGMSIRNALRYYQQGGLGLVWVKLDQIKKEIDASV